MSGQTRYSPEVRERAVRMVLEHQSEYASQWQAVEYILERQMEKDMALFPEEDVQEIHYQDLDEGLVHRLGAWCEVPLGEEAEIPTFLQDDPGALQPEELDMLNRLVEKYPFKKEIFA